MSLLQGTDGRGVRHYLLREVFRNFTAILWFLWASSTSFWCRSPRSFWRCMDFLQRQGAVGMDAHERRLWRGRGHLGNRCP